MITELKAGVGVFESRCCFLKSNIVNWVKNHGFVTVERTAKRFYRNRKLCLKKKMLEDVGDLSPGFRVTFGLFSIFDALLSCLSWLVVLFKL